MDFDDLGNKIANLTFYDIKQAWTQAKNYALNVSDIEAKVNEATNDEPWGASSTLMQEIAQATNNFADFNEIMPCIFRNFMEREAREWRQIYKSLQLLEYIIKHGNERVVDDARAHLGTIKILRNFHYIDEAGKDQGLNVRNRAKELSELLGDVDRIRQERRKAKANRTKYSGVSNSDFVPGSGGGRYGGFGSDSYYAGGAAGGSSSSAQGSAARESFDEYDAGDDEVATGGRAPRARVASSTGRGTPTVPSKSKKPEPKVADLFSFDDEEPVAASAPAAASSAAAADDFGDDFDDFQAAPTVTKSTIAPKKATPAAASKPAGGDVFDFLGGSDAPAAASVASNGASRPPMGGSMLSPTARPSSTASVPQSFGTTLQPQQSTTRPSISSNNSMSSAAKPASSSSGLGGFDDLWSSSSGKSSSSAGGSGGKTMADLAKERSGAGVWGSTQQAQSKPSPLGAQQPKKDLFDLL